jgi:hypothetical protein
MGFQPTIPVFERAKTFHALDIAVAVIGMEAPSLYKLKLKCSLNEFLVKLYYGIWKTKTVFVIEINEYILQKKNYSYLYVRALPYCKTFIICLCLNFHLVIL